MTLHAIQANIVRNAQWFIRKSPATFHFVHVYVPKYISVRFKELSQIYQLNVTCEKNAKQDLHQWIADILNPNPWKLSHTWACWVDNVFVTGQVEKGILESEGIWVVSDFLQKRKYISKSKSNMINWDTLDPSLTSNIALFSLWSTKSVSDFCSTSKLLHRCNLKEDPTCPWCRKKGVIKDIYHVLRWPAPQMRKFPLRGKKRCWIG